MPPSGVLVAAAASDVDISTLARLPGGGVLADSGPTLNMDLNGSRSSNQLRPAGCAGRAPRRARAGGSWSVRIYCPNGPGCSAQRPLARSFGVVQAGSMRIGQVAGSRDFLLLSLSAAHCTGQARGAALRTASAMRLGPVRAGEGAAGDERSGCQPRRAGPAALAVAREFRPGTGRGAWLPGDGGCVRVRADLGATPGRGSRWARCLGGADLAVLPGLLSEGDMHEQVSRNRAHLPR